jgi:putative ABC transport system permease protein
VLPYLLRSLAERFRSGRALFGLTIFGVALGVASVLSIQILNRNALAAFAGSVHAIRGDADLTVIGRGPAIPESLYMAILATPGVAAASPLVQIEVALEGRDDFFLQILGVDLLAPSTLPWRGAPPDVQAALAIPGWVAITPDLARALARHEGDSLAVTSGSRRAVLRVGALVDFRRVSPVASTRLAVMDIAQAQARLGVPGTLSQVDVRLAEGASRAVIAREIERRLGGAAQALTPEQRERQAASLLAAFRLNLTALSLISLFVGAFLVASSTLASLVRRRRELGLLRSIGASRTQVGSIVLAEISLLALLGVAIGLPIGYWVAAANVRTVSATLSNLYLLQEIEKLVLPPGIAALAALVGIGGALLGALAPALETARRDPRALLAAFPLHERLGERAGALAAAAAGIAGAGALVYLLAEGRWTPAGFAVALAALLAVPLATPLVLLSGARAVRVHRFGLWYGVRALGERLPVTAFAVAALAVAISMLFGITILVGSFRDTVRMWIESTARADVYVSTASWARGRREASMDSALIATLRALPGVRAMDRLRQLDVGFGDRRLVLSGIDIGLPAGEARFPLLEGDTDDAIERLRDGGEVLIGEPLARRSHLGVGDTLRVYGPLGPVGLRVAGVYYDYTTESGTATVDLRAMEHRFGAGPINNVALYAERGVDPERLVDEIRVRLPRAPLNARSNRALRREVLAIFDQTFAVTRLLQAMCLLIAVCGIALALLVQARERASELALYRALGATRGQILWMFVGKGLGMSAFGLLLGAAGGAALAFTLLFLINRDYFGWTLSLVWPWRALAGQVALIVAAALAASLYPALRASQTPATQLSRDDL